MRRSRPCASRSGADRSGASRSGASRSGADRSGASRRGGGRSRDRRWRAWADRAERGSASLEFITAGLILLVPLVYLVLAMAALQGGALAVEGAARQAARVYV
ncbi:MAG TPA: hypothetical protein VLO31_10065, partial [Cryobacterium sp.]|nr:hypothetical protein [Cryobacterium sp.]